MVVFNATFSSDKPVYFPTNWHTGKTEQQLYLEWQESWQYGLYSTLLQTVASAGWLALFLVIAVACRHIYRLWKLPEDCNEKKYNRRYLKGKFLGPVAVLSSLWLGVTCYLLFGSQWTRHALFKGLILLSTLVGCYWSYSKTKLAAWKWRRQQKLRERYQPVSQTQEATLS